MTDSSLPNAVIKIKTRLDIIAAGVSVIHALPSLAYKGDVRHLAASKANPQEGFRKSQFGDSPHRLQYCFS